MKYGILVALITILASVAGTAAHQGPAHCATWWLQQQTGRLLPVDLTNLPCDDTPVGPPPNPQVGDQWDWYIWRLNGPPQADLLPCTVRGSSEHAYVVVENSQWNVNIGQSDVDTILERFENTSVGQFPDQGIWDLNTTTFGMPPDHLDQDGKIYLVYYEFDVASDGYFWVFDQACDGTQPYASNECDAVYLNCGGPSPSGDYMLAVAAHEMQHLIHHEHDDNEASWVDEGCGELAMWLYGHPDSISAFNTNPDRTLTTWNGQWADYIKTYLWMLYFYERFGGGTTVFDLVHDPANSINGFVNVWNAHSYPVTFEEVFADWTIANYLDDPSLLDGRYGYLGDDLPPFNPAAHMAAYPFSATATVNHWAADYISMTDATNLLVWFDGSLPSQFAVWALLFHATEPVLITEMSLDGQQDGQLALPGMGNPYSETILVVAKTSGSGDTAYTYGAEELPVPTPTPEATPVPTPTVKPTWMGAVPAVNLTLNQELYQAEDPFILDAVFWNPLDETAHLAAFIVLGVGDLYWFWPSWIFVDDGLDFGERRIPAATQSPENILDFAWPAGAGAAGGICFLAAVLDYETGSMYGDTIDMVCFSYN
ncbi:hypothetical protein JW905_09170 [bacterium]|nr:hypothetical protein [candidate division CSSED10-310 bacterium]